MKFGVKFLIGHASTCDFTVDVLDCLQETT